ncbi:MAG TPA: undecaprenyl-diphosphate phosphatase [Clostridia bacterium]|nr:undecaprenyl-diphosphate phosphatase [Clostridia bacterium]
MSLLQSLIMGLVQGLTEFLPVSSSGHLVLANALLGIQTNTGILFEVMLHVGTLVSVIIVFRRDIFSMVKEFFAVIKDVSRGRGMRLKSSPHRMMTAMVIVATIPTGLIGILFGDFFEKAFSSTVIVSIMLLVTGVFLYAANTMKEGRKGPSEIKAKDAVIIGIFQGLAITPGISRSGSTIFAGLMRGFSRELATKFSFIMSIPAIIGAAVLEFSDLQGASVSLGELSIMFAGTVAAVIAGTIAIKFLIGVLNRGKLNYFSYYCWLVGLTGLVTVFLGR